MQLNTIWKTCLLSFTLTAVACGIEAEEPLPEETLSISQVELALDGMPDHRLPGAGSPPVVRCMDLTVSADLTCSASGSVDAGSSDPDGDLVDCMQSPAGPYPLGKTAVTLTCKDQRRNIASCTATVTVEDTTPPQVVLQGSESETFECFLPYSGNGDPEEYERYVDPGATAADACNGDLSSSVLTLGEVNSQTPGSYTLEYDVVDSAGNPASAVRIVEVVDTQAPTVTLQGPAYLELKIGEPYVEQYAIAMDRCAGYLPVWSTGAVNTNVPGTYTITYEAYDGFHVSTATRTVVVTWP